MADLVTLATEGKVEDLLLGLGRRIDATEQVTRDRALAAFEARTDNPKMSWGEVENAGVALSPEKPEYQEAVVKAILTYCTEVRLKKLYESRPAMGPAGSN